MAHGPNDWIEISRTAIGIMVKHPHFSAALLSTVFVVLWWIITGGLGNQEPTWIRQHGRMFPHTELVHDIYNGSLKSLFQLINYQQLHFVAFYAPWSADSRTLIPEFMMAAKQLKEEAVFIAINCWVGSCRANYTFSGFPRLYGYHTKKPVEYIAALDHNKMVDFLRMLMRPFRYIAHPSQLWTYLDANEVVVLGYYKKLGKDVQYSMFFYACMLSVNRVNRASFGLITHEEIAHLVHLKNHGDLQLHSIFSSSLPYPKELNYTADAIHGWIYSHSKKIVIELTPNASDLNFYRDQLKKGGGLLLFLPSRSKKRREILLAYKSTAYLYNNCSCPTPSFDVQESDFSPVSAKPDEAYIRKGCISSIVSIQKELHSCRLEICHFCCYPCSRRINALKTLQYLIKKGFIMEYCKQTRKCFSSANNNYYYDEHIVICQLKTELVENHQDDNGEMDGKKEIDHFVSVLQDIRKVLLALFQNSDPRSIEDVHKQIKILTNDKWMADITSLQRSKQEKVEEVLKSKEEQTRNLTKTDASGRPAQESSSDCNSPLDATFIQQLKNNATSNFPGLKCRTNRTLNFYYFDSDIYFSIAKGLGVNQSNLVDARTTLAIVDVKTEATYLFPEYKKIEESSLIAFIVNYTLGTLRRKLRSSSPSSKRICFKDKIGLFCYVDVSSDSFEQTVLGKNKDVLLLYSTPWCGHCVLPNHLLLQLANVLRKVTSLILARIDIDKNDLPYEFAVDAVPTFILFPAARKDESVKYPDDMALTLENMLSFLFRFGSEKTRSRLEYLLPTKR